MSSLFYFILLSITFSYVILVAAATISWNNGADLNPGDTSKPVHPVFLSVIIPFRNEVGQLPALLQALRTQSLQKIYWECIFVNDHSQDQGQALIWSSTLENVRVITNPGQGKKSAIAAGLECAKGDYIVQTDADCIMGREWLKTIHSTLSLSSNSVAAGPVSILNPVSWSDHFQAYDFMALMGMTCLGIQSRMWYMANGANLAYHRNIYDKMKNTGEYFDLASGDDMFLIETASTMINTPIHFLKDPNALVQTRAVSDLRSFIYQRLRWGSKNGRLKDWKIKMVLGLTLLFSVALVVVTLLTVVNKDWWLIAGSMWLIKATIDLMLLYTLSPFFNQKISIPYYLVCSVIYPVYLCIMVILSIFKRNYEWKGRISR